MRAVSTQQHVAHWPTARPPPFAVLTTRSVRRRRHSRLLNLFRSPRLLSVTSLPRRVFWFVILASPSDDNPLAPPHSTWSKYDFAAYNSFGRMLYVTALAGMCTSICARAL